MVCSYSVNFVDVALHFRLSLERKASGVVHSAVAVSSAHLCNCLCRLHVAELGPFVFGPF